jgi:alpha-L-fucosidase
MAGLAPAKPYADARVRELIQRYRPSVRWNDISWPTGQQRLNAIFPDYYNTVPDGVVNDRWQTDSLFHRLMGLPPARSAFDRFFKQVIATTRAWSTRSRRPRCPTPTSHPRVHPVRWPPCSAG